MAMNKFTYREATISDIDAVTDLLYLLYDGEGLGLTRDELLDENKQHFADSNQVLFLAYDGHKPIGISHGSLRREYVNGANDGLKGYLEAIYVLPEYRLNGIATELIKTIENWAAQHGCREIASDCQLNNIDSYNFHLKLGYEETERNIFFLKPLKPVNVISCKNTSIYTSEELREALRSIESTAVKCEKAITKLREGTSQHTLTKRRIEAFDIAMELIKEKLEAIDNA